MSDPIPPPKSAARVWMRILAWIIPGVAAPAILLGWFSMIYATSANELAVTIAALVLLVATVLGCGFFNAVLRRPDPAKLPASRAKSIALSIVIFVLLQVIVLPAIGYTVAFGCNLMMGNL